jgi:hypothetical protein
VADTAGDRAMKFECMERFVRTFETRWDQLINWYAAESNQEKMIEWCQFAVARGDEKRAENVAL